MREKGIVSTGWSLVWRHQRILWWVFAINMFLGYMATIAPRAAMSAVLDNSMHAKRLAWGFDIIAFVDLVSRPDIPMNAFITGSAGFALFFFAFMLFVTGGILAAYREDRKLSAGEFFQASGEYFWRMVRLVLMSVVPFGVIAALWSVIYGIGNSMTDTMNNERIGYYVMWAAMGLAVVLSLLVRLWFDVAQVRAVAQNEHGMFHNLMRSFVITARAAGTLLWIYFRISLVAWIAIAVGMWLRSRLPGNQIGTTWVVLELVLLLQIFARLWQRAASVTWYARYAETHPAAVVDFTTPEPVELVETVATPPAEPAPAEAPPATNA